MGLCYSKNRILFALVFVLIIFGLFTGNSADAQVVTNGSVTGAPAQNNGINAGNAPGWTGCGFSPDLCDLGLPSYVAGSQVPASASPDGGTWLGMADVGSAPCECAQTTITGLTVGTTYDLCFWGANFGAGTGIFSSTPATPTVTVGAFTQTYNIPLLANVWTQYVLTFTATATTENLVVNHCHPNSNWAYASLDGFVVNSVGSCSTPCSFNTLMVNVSACNPNSTYVVYGNVTFTNPPVTGTLTITDGCSGLDTVINAPFISPLNWSVSGNPTGTGNCDVTAVFSADPACTINLGPSNLYSQVAPCGCVANIGTFNTSITPNNGQTPNILCFGDQFTINSNGDNIDPDPALAPPGPPYNPGIGYLIYSCPPTIALVPSNVFPNDNITNDPCFVGLVGFGNSFNDVNILGGPSFGGPWTNNTIYYVPITFYDTISGTYSYVNTTMPCYSMGQPYAVQYLTQITTAAVPDCQTGSVTVMVTGGLPEADGSLYTASNLLPATASFVNTTATHGGNIDINGLQNGDMYSFDIVDLNGCPVTVTGGPFIGLPTANAGVDDTTCTLTYNLNAVASFGTGTWTGAGVFGNPNAATTTVTVAAPGTLTFTWTEDNTSGCISTDNVTITFNILSIPNTPTNPLCNGGNDGQIVLAPQGGVSPYTYQWDAAANNQITNPATNLAAGSYMVTVTDNFGCFLDSTYTLTEPLPFTFTTDSVNANCGNPDGSATVVGFAGGTAGYTYDWGAGPVVSNTLTNLVPGPYIVTVADVYGCDTTFTITVGNNAPFTASITAFTNVTCNGLADGTATGDGSDPFATYSFLWDAAAGNQTTQMATGLGAGTYMVTVTDPATSCIDTVSVIITEPPALTVSAGADITICTSGNANLSALGGGGSPGYTYFWDNGLGVGQTHNVSPAIQTTYIVTVTDDSNCTTTDSVIVFVSPPLIVTASADDSICPGDPIAISVIASNGGFGVPPVYSYSWNNGPNSQSQTVTPGTTTTYIVTLTDGCSPAVSDSVTIVVNSLPIVNFLADTLGLCESPQQSFTFYNQTSPNGGITSWTFGDGNGASGDIVSHAYANPGSYDITLTVTGINGCTDFSTKFGYVSVFANPVANFSMDPTPASMFDPTVNFFDLSYNNIVGWTWNIGGLDTSILQNPSYIFPEDTGHYLIVLTVVDVNGCVDTTSGTAIVIGEYGIYVPNAFTPDGDGLNEGFFPNGFGIADDDYTFMIFDRWGEIIFESHKKFEPWNGTYKGEIVQNGVYVWKLFFTDINGKQHIELGHTSVIR